MLRLAMKAIPLRHDAEPLDMCAAWTARFWRGLSPTILCHSCLCMVYGAIDELNAFMAAAFSRMNTCWRSTSRQAS